MDIQSGYDITLSQKLLSFYVILLNYVRSIPFYYYNSITIIIISL